MSSKASINVPLQLTNNVEYVQLVFVLSSIVDLLWLNRCFSILSSILSDALRWKMILLACSYATSVIDVAEGVKVEPLIMCLTSFSITQVSLMKVSINFHRPDESVDDPRMYRPRLRTNKHNRVHTIHIDLKVRSLRNSIWYTSTFWTIR